MTTLFGPEIYRQRRRRLARSVRSGLIVLFGNATIPMDYPNQGYSFRQDASFLYFFGLDHEDLVGVIDTDSGEAWIYGEDLSVEQMIVYKPRPPLTRLAEQVGIEHSASVEDFVRNIQSTHKAGRVIHLLPLYRAENRLKLSEWLRIPPWELEKMVSLDLIKSIVSQRSYKSNLEITQIKTAIETTRTMQLVAMKRSAVGVKEAEVVAALEMVPRATHVDLTFPTICTVHGEIHHMQDYRNTMRERDMVVCDCGAKSPMHYSADITRSFPVRGRFDERQGQIYAIVLEAQQNAIRVLRPGIKFRDVYLGICREFTQALKVLGLMKGDVDEAVANGAHTLFFQGSPGHMIGLGGHDMQELGEDHVGYSDAVVRSDLPGLKSLRLAKHLEAGFVLTVEPGIYFNPQLIDFWQSHHLGGDFINFPKLADYMYIRGIRIEDMVLITSDGHQNLTASIPKTIEGVEQACQ